MHASPVLCKNPHNAAYRETCDYNPKESRENIVIHGVDSRESYIALGKESPKDGGSA